MQDDWQEIATRVIGLGAPLLGGALGGPLGSAAGAILANALGVTTPTPAALNEALAQGADSAATADAIGRAEVAWAAAVAAIGQAQVAEVGQTMRAEAMSGDILQRVWRPLYALELSLVECPAFAFTLLRSLWLGHEPGINGFATLSGLLMAYFAARFGVLGVYLSGRSREKQARSGSAGTSPVAQVARAAAKALGKGR